MGTVNRMIAIYGLSLSLSSLSRARTSLSQIFYRDVCASARVCSLILRASEARVSSRNYASFFEAINRLVHFKGLISEGDSCGGETPTETNEAFLLFRDDISGRSWCRICVCVCGTLKLYRVFEMFRQVEV